MSKYKRTPTKDNCAFCCEKWYWKKNSPKLQKGNVIFYACVAEHDKGLDFSLIVIT